MNTPQPRPNMPNIELPENLEPIYANLVRIAHSPAELVLDFARLLPGQPTAARVLARILMSPVGAKLFSRALNENLARYEAAYGEITIPNDSNLANELFKPIHPPE